MRGITDGNSNLIQSYEYTAFGERTTDIKQKSFLFFGNKINQPYGFTGRPVDKVTGLYDYRFRDYNPEIGRFIQPDPLGQLPGPNIYAYCNNNPINLMDNEGQTPY
ncbi:MAG: RHS repeat-associated core domain-containing protein [bacterium]|nr:RHS repeat-associated core domain-containing protein [bacterium]